MILAFDTSAAHCAAALLIGDRIVASAFEPMEKGQAERLLPLLQEVLAEAGLGWRDLTALAVGTGPGNFTGVRIAVAAARGLALGLGIPAVGITRLEALAFGLPRPITVVEDARRCEVYVQGFGTETSEALLLDGSDLAHVVATAHVTGSAAGPAGLPAAVPLAEAMGGGGGDASPGARHHPKMRPLFMREDGEGKGGDWGFTTRANL